MTLLQVENLRICFHTRNGITIAVDNMNFSLASGKVLGIVGESGSGKSVACYSLLGLIPSPPGKVESGRALFAGDDLLSMNEKSLRKIRGHRISMIFQDPMTALNPYMRIADQLVEPLIVQKKMSRKDAKAKAITALEEVGIHDAVTRINDYPHQFSGGMRQRVMIAMALISEPELLIADEPTTALDVTIQAQILELLKSLQQEFGMAILIITHDLGVIAEMADEVSVMYMGKIVESGDVRTIFRRPLHPYTVGLMRSIPRLGSHTKERLTPIPGSVPDSLTILPGCAFAPRCPAPKRGICYEPVDLVEIEPGHRVRCTLYPQAGALS